LESLTYLSAPLAPARERILAELSGEATTSPEAEYAKYLALGTEMDKDTPDQQVLDLWKCSSCHLPRLSAVARQLLAIPASSSGCERSFSRMGHLWRKSRARLTLEKVEAMMLLQYQGAVKDSTSDEDDVVEA
jgi:hypothetical protein